MKSTTFTLLAAALASVCAAAPTAVAPAAVVTTPLPARFTLSYVPISRAADGHKFRAGDIFGSDGYGGDLEILQIENTGHRKITEFIGNGTSAYVHIDEFPANINFYINMKSTSRIYTAFSDSFSNLGSGLALVNGDLTWDAGLGLGPQALWTACGDINVYWNGSWDSCVKIAMKVHAL